MCAYIGKWSVTDNLLDFPGHPSYNVVSYNWENCSDMNIIMGCYKGRVLRADIGTLSSHVIQLPDKSSVNDVTSLHQVYYTEVIILFSSVVVACNLWWVW